MKRWTFETQIRFHVGEDFHEHHPLSYELLHLATASATYEPDLILNSSSFRNESSENKSPTSAKTIRLRELCEFPSTQIDNRIMLCQSNRRQLPKGSREIFATKHKQKSISHVIDFWVLGLLMFFNSFFKSARFRLTDLCCVSLYSEHSRAMFECRKIWKWIGERVLCWNEF